MLSTILAPTAFAVLGISYSYAFWTAAMPALSSMVLAISSISFWQITTVAPVALTFSTMSLNILVSSSMNLASFEASLIVIMVLKVVSSMVNGALMIAIFAFSTLRGMFGWTSFWSRVTPRMNFVSVIAPPTF